MSGAFRKNHTSVRVPTASRDPSTASPIGVSNVRTSVENPLEVARTASNLLAWYVLTSSVEMGQGALTALAQIAA